MLSLRSTLVALFSLVAVVIAPAARADSAAQSFIQQRQQQVSTLLSQPAGATRDKAIAAVLDGMLDYDRFARDSLAKHWDETPEEKRKEFASLLKQLIQRNYEKNIKSIAEYDVSWLGEDPGAEGVVVHSSAASRTDKHEDPITIDYRVRTEGTGFRVFDIITEGSSMVTNYRNQFHRIIQKDGIDALLKRMRDKLAKGAGTV